MTRTPQLIQYGDLTPTHFAAHPVWAACHVFDYDEPWYDDTDEETFRPWDGPLPADPGLGTFVVRGTLTLADGSRHPGFLTPGHGGATAGHRALGEIQPQLFLSDGRRIGFWLGMFGEPAQEAAALYAALGRPREGVFPARFAADPGLATGVTEGVIRGFYTIPDRDTVRVES